MSEESFPGSAADFYERIQELKAEVEKLGLALHNERQYAADLITTLRCEAEDRNRLITELADALEKQSYWAMTDPGLLQRAREAVR